MSKLVSSRAFRLLICLLLVCCILVNTSPIRARATAVVPAASAALVGITPLGAVVGILACLGLAYVASGSFEATCKKIADSLPSRFLSFGNSQTVVEGLSYEDSVYVSEELVEYVASSVTLGLDDNTAFPLPRRAAPFIQALLSSSVYSYYQSYHSNWTLATYIGLSNGEHHLILHDTSVSYTNSTDSCTVVYPEPCIHYVGTVDLDTYPEYTGGITGGNEMSMSGQTSRTMNLDGVTVVSFLTVDLTSAVFQPYFEAAPDLDDDEEYQAWKARRLFRVIEGGEDPDDDTLELPALESRCIMPRM